MSDTVVTVGDDGSSAAETAEVNSVSEAGHAAGLAEAAAEQARESAAAVDNKVESARIAADDASRAAEATANAALSTSINAQEVNGSIASLRDEIAALRQALTTPVEPAVDLDGDGVPDPVTASDVAPHDQEPQKKGNWLNRRITFGKKS